MQAAIIGNSRAQHPATRNRIDRTLVGILMGASRTDDALTALRVAFWRKSGHRRLGYVWHAKSGLIQGTSGHKVGHGDYKTASPTHAQLASLRLRNIWRGPDAINEQRGVAPRFFLNR
jgi:hypothetical protein